MATSKTSGPKFGSYGLLTSVAIPAIGAGSSFTFFIQIPTGSTIKLAAASAYVGSVGGGTVALDIGTAATPNLYMNATPITTALSYQVMNGSAAQNGVATPEGVTLWQARVSTTGGTGSTAGFLLVYGWIPEPPTSLVRL